MERSQLRIADLKQRVPASNVMMNTKIPGQLMDAIARLAKQLHTSKTQVVVALLNGGLERAAKIRGAIGSKRK